MKIFTLILSTGLFCALQAQSIEDALRPFGMLNYAGSGALGLSSDLTANPHLRQGFSRNPAVIGLIKRPQLLFSFQNERQAQKSYLTASYDDQGSYICESTERTKQAEATRFDGFRVVYPIPVYRGSWVIACGFAPVYSYINNFQSTGVVPTSEGKYRLQQTINEDGVLNMLQLATAIEFQHHLLVGLAVNRYNGFRNYLSTATDEDFEDNFTYQQFIQNVTLKPNYTGWNLDGGIFWDHSPILIGTRFSTPLKLKVKEDYQLTEIERMDNDYATYSADTSTYHYNLRAPWEWGMGLAYERRRYTFSVEISQRDWRNLEFSSHLYTPDTTRLDPVINTAIAQQLRSAWQWGCGLNLNLSPRTNLQLGYRAIQRPYRHLPSNQSNFQQFSIGLELALDPQIFIGTAYQLTTGTTTLTNTFFQVDSVQKLRQNRWSLSLAIIL